MRLGEGAMSFETRWPRTGGLAPGSRRTRDPTDRMPAPMNPTDPRHDPTTAGAADRCELQERYLELTWELLLAAAVAAAGKDDRWPIRFDHCFMRVALDHVFGGCWYDHLDRKLRAYKQLDDDQLAAAVGHAEAMLEGGRPVVEEMNRRSLACAGRADPVVRAGGASAASRCPVAPGGGGSGGVPADRAGVNPPPPDPAMPDPRSAAPRPRPRPRPPGFTLVEVLIVVVIVGILAGLTTGLIRGKTAEARVVAVDQQLAAIQSAIALFEQLYGRPPAELADLTERPSYVPPSAWREPFIAPRELDDPWGHPLVYAYPAENGGYALLSTGADGLPGGEGPAADHAR